MKIAIDESGNYMLGAGRFEASVLCAVIVPHSRLDAVERFVNHACKRWHRSELKSSKMKPGWFDEVATFIACHQIAAVAFVTDNETMTRRLVQEHRLDQAAAIAAGRDQLRAANAADPRLADIDTLIARVAGAPGPEPISDDDFIQSQQIPELLLDCVRNACTRYRDPAWAADFERFDIVLDAKHSDRLKAGEKYVDDNIERMLASTERFVLNLPEEWAESPEHPFRRFDSHEAGFTQLDLLLGERKWAHSEEDACIQLADVLAGIVRDTVEAGAKSSRWRAYQTLRMVLTDIKGDCLRVFRFTGAPAPDLTRYAPLVRAWPQPQSLRRISAAGAVALGRRPET